MYTYHMYVCIHMYIRNIIVGYVDMCIYVFVSTQQTQIVGWLCCTSHRQRGRLEMAPPIYCPLRRT